MRLNSIAKIIFLYYCSLIIVRTIVLSSRYYKACPRFLERARERGKRMEGRKCEVDAAMLRAQSNKMCIDFTIIN